MDGAVNIQVHCNCSARLMKTMLPVHVSVLVLKLVLIYSTFKFARTGRTDNATILVQVASNTVSSNTDINNCSNSINSTHTCACSCYYRTACTKDIDTCIVCSNLDDAFVMISTMHISLPPCTGINVMHSCCTAALQTTQ